MRVCVVLLQKKIRLEAFDLKRRCRSSALSEAALCEACRCVQAEQKQYLTERRSWGAEVLLLFQRSSLHPPPCAEYNAETVAIKHCIVTLYAVLNILKEDSSVL